MKKLICGVCFLSMLLFTVVAGAETCCTVPDNGQGTADFPPSPCSYANHTTPAVKMQIINGLPAGTTIDIASVIQNMLCNQANGICSFAPNCRQPGGPLGGEMECFSAMLMMPMAGTGSLAGFNRVLQVQVGCETHIGSRLPGAPIQSFDTEMSRMQGQITGDPDFDLLRITAGTDFGMPSPGITTLTRQADGQWAVDSFFDITYRIDFVGHPGGRLGGLSGSTTGTIRLSVCDKGTPGGGDDCYDVTCGDSQKDFSSNPIPASFFDPGSEPFDGRIMLGGGNSAGADTIVRRLRDAILPGPGSSDVVPIELIALNLVSCQPITVRYGQQPSEQWNVSVGLSPSVSSTGQMAIIKTYANGGTFTSTLFVQAKFTFTKMSDPSQIRVLDLPLNLSTTAPHRWQDTSPKPNPPCNGNGFYPGTEGPVTMSSQSGDAVLVLEPPLPPSPYIALNTKSQWSDALASGAVAAMGDAEGQAYMDLWHGQSPNIVHEGIPYPPTTFMSPELSAWDPEGVCPTDPNWPDSAGLVMAWHYLQPQSGGSFSAAWKYVYPADPDLTNVVITVTVMPPCSTISTVSFGLKDITGKIRAWHWNVPGTLPCGVPTTITIDTSVSPPGLLSASPAANGYMSDTGFDITQVVELLFDENCTWVAGTTVPPPGTTVPRAWNYWHDLIITPKPVNPVRTLKWSQPPVKLNEGVILGWDEKSVYNVQPLMADDWLCKDQRPVTDIHWWGSFIGWMKPDMPTQRPVAFRFGIWTDVPKNPNDLKSYSHPGKLLWEYRCTDFQWKFIGYDKDPRKTANIALTTTAAAFNPMVNDSCFEFDCNLPQSVWYYQKPGPNGQGTVYWLSIAAEYSANTTLVYPWGWKTRPHYFNDDAVRIRTTKDPTGNLNWPPALYSTWESGQPIEYPRGISWDLAFELTTNSTTVPPTVDYNADGTVNFVDLAIFASHWLENN